MYNAAGVLILQVPFANQYQVKSFNKFNFSIN